MNRKWIIVAVCIVSIVTGSFGFRQSVQAGANPPADQTGPYQAGFVMNIYYDSARSDFMGGARPIVTFIWYPAVPDNNGNPMLPAVYSMNPLGLNGLPVVSSTDFETYGVDPAYQEVAASAEGPFPLVVLSPGLGGTSLMSAHIGARLASHGFVVAAPTNYGDGAMGEPYWEFYPTGEAWQTWTYIERTRDIQYLMTRLVADANEPGNLLYGAIRADQIAVSGHSWGGGAALALAGGDDLACDLPGLDPSLIPPETCFPILPDPRIQSVVPLDGSSQVLHYAEMARIKIPHMVIGQEWGRLAALYPGWEAYLARQHSAVQGHPNYRVDIAHYPHNSFIAACSWLHVLRDYGVIDDSILAAYLPGYCPQEPAPPDEIGNLVTRYLIAFLKTALVREPGYQDMLTPGYALANEPFIEFFVTEKRNPNALDEDWPDHFTYFMHQPGSEQARALKDPPGMELAPDALFMP